VHLGVEATVEMIPAEAPDAVIVATGAVPRRPDVPGVDLPGVATVEDILLGSVPGGPRCLVLDGTGHVQAGLAADLLARQGHTVTVAAPYHTVCDNVEPSTKEPLLERLYQGNVTLVPDAILTAIEQDETAGGFRSWFANEYSGRRFAIDGVDTVVLAYGGRAVNDLYARLKGRVPELRLVGDAMAPRSLHDALLEGTRAARQL
jgi:pyruvate/2-oxoglutarate dehydrogenase complex dihydrolipoamide dehydrogenase (E3) component